MKHELEDASIRFPRRRTKKICHCELRCHVELQKPEPGLAVVLGVKVQARTLGLDKRFVAIFFDRAAPVMGNCDLGREQNPGSLGANARAQVDVFRVEEELFVEASNALEELATGEQARAAYPLDGTFLAWRLST